MANPALLALLSTKEMQDEIERRKAAMPPMPELTGRIELESLLELCKQYIYDLSNGGGVDEDMEYNIFEAAVEAFYGKDIFDWVNKQIK